MLEAVLNGIYFIFAFMKDYSRKIEKEKQTVELMIRLYCKHIEKNNKLCPSCKELLEYAHARLDHCRFGQDKPSCRNCPVHCYKPIMRERIKVVMRTIGPRMFFYAPIAALKHLIGR